MRFFFFVISRHQKKKSYNISFATAPVYFFSSSPFSSSPSHSLDFYRRRRRHHWIYIVYECVYKVTHTYARSINNAAPSGAHYRPEAELSATIYYCAVEYARVFGRWWTVVTARPLLFFFLFFSVQYTPRHGRPYPQILSSHVATVVDID